MVKSIKDKYTIDDFNEVIHYTCGTSEESRICEDVFRFFKEHPEELLKHPRMKELDYNVDDIKNMLDTGLSGCITEFY